MNAPFLHTNEVDVASSRHCQLAGKRQNVLMPYEVNLNDWLKFFNHTDQMFIYPIFYIDVFFFLNIRVEVTTSRVNISWSRFSGRRILGVAHTIVLDLF